MLKCIDIKKLKIIIWMSIRSMYIEDVDENYYKMSEC